MDAYTKALQQAEEKKDSNQIADCLKGIGSVILEKSVISEKGQWTFAAKVLNASLDLFQRQPAQNKVAIKLVLTLMVEVERGFLKKECGIAKLDLSARSQIYLDRRRQLKELRLAIQASIDKSDGVKQTLEEFSNGIGTFLHSIMKEMYLIIGTPPCEFTVLSLGSLARKEMSPYSDLEFAFLVEHSSKENIAYFRTVVRWLEIQVIHLGETPIKILDGGYVSPVKPGFCYDLGGNTPLGKPGQLELINTPFALAQFQTERFYSEDFILSNVLRTAGLLLGSTKLYEEYLQAMATITSQLSSKSSLILRKERALSSLNGHLDEFKPRINKEKQERPVFNVKVELYRIPNFLIAGLAEYFGIETINSWEQLDALAKKEKPILSEEGVTHLKEALNEIMHLRMRCHIHYKHECDYVCHPSMQQNDGQERFILSPSDLEKLTQIYRVILPHFRAFEEACRTQDFADLVKVDFYDPIFEAQAKMKDELGQYDESEKYYLQALALQPDNADLQIDFSYVLIRKTMHARSNHIKVEDQWLLDIKEYINNALIVAQRTKNQALLAKVKSLEAYYTMTICNDRIKAFANYQEALKITQSVYGDTHPALATILGYMGIMLFENKDKRIGEQMIKKAIEIYKLNHIEVTDVAYFMNYLGVGMLREDQTNEALNHLQSALRINMNLLGEENSIVAWNLSWIGFAFKKLAKKKEAKEHYEQALRVGRRVFNENHSIVALCIKGIGEINHAPHSDIIQPLDTIEAIIQKQDEELEALIREHGDDDVAIADVRVAIGGRFDLLGKHDEALDCYQKA